MRSLSNRGAAQAASAESCAMESERAPGSRLKISQTEDTITPLSRMPDLAANPPENGARRVDSRRIGYRIRCFG